MCGSKIYKQVEFCMLWSSYGVCQVERIFFCAACLAAGRSGVGFDQSNLERKQIGAGREL